MTRRLDTQFRRAMRLPSLAGGNLGSILARDEGRCHLCRTRVARDEATRDHVIPVSAGGDESRINTALAHARCNVARGDLPLHLAKAVVRDMEMKGRVLTQHTVSQALAAAFVEWRAHRYDTWEVG